MPRREGKKGVNLSLTRRNGHFLRHLQPSRSRLTPGRQKHANVPTKINKPQVKEEEVQVNEKEEEETQNEESEGKVKENAGWKKQQGKEE